MSTATAAADILSMLSHCAMICTSLVGTNVLTTAAAGFNGGAWLMNQDGFPVAMPAVAGVRGYNVSSTPTDT